MVVMDGVCAAVAGGGSSSHGSDPVSALNAAAAISGNHHRAWYDASTAAALQQQASAAAGDDINAYFKAGTAGAANAAVASSYFSQMQDAYSGMSSYHGRCIYFGKQLLLKCKVVDSPLYIVHYGNFL